MLALTNSQILLGIVDHVCLVFGNIKTDRKSSLASCFRIQVFGTRPSNVPFSEID